MEADGTAQELVPALNECFSRSPPWGGAAQFNGAVKTQRTRQLLRRSVGVMLPRLRIYSYEHSLHCWTGQQWGSAAHEQGIPQRDGTMGSPGVREGGAMGAATTWMDRACRRE